MWFVVESTEVVLRLSTDSSHLRTVRLKPHSPVSSIFTFCAPISSPASLYHKGTILSILKVKEETRDKKGCANNFISMACFPPMYPSASAGSGLTAFTVVDPIITQEPCSQQQQKQKGKIIKVQIPGTADSATSPRRRHKVNITMNITSRITADVVGSSDVNGNNTSLETPITTSEAVDNSNSFTSSAPGSPVYSPRSPRARKIGDNAFPQPNRSFTVTYTNKGLFALQQQAEVGGQERASLSMAQVKCWETVETPRPDLDHQIQVDTMKEVTRGKKLTHVTEMRRGLKLSRALHQIHLRCLVSEGGWFQRRVLANAPTGYQRPDALMAMGAATLQAQGLSCGNPYRKPTFMLANQPKLWLFLLADIATLLLEPIDEEPATPKFVADQIYSLNLFQQSNFVV